MIGLQKFEVFQECLYFQKNDKKYLYGLTESLLLSSRSSKISPDFLILPSSAYKSRIFRYAHLDQLLHNFVGGFENPHSNSQAGLRVQQLCRNIKQLILPHKTSLKTFDIEKLKTKPQKQIDFYSNHQINEAELIDILDRQRKVSSLVGKAKGVPAWINHPPSDLKIVVPEVGMTTYLCLETHLIAVNPTHHFVQDLMQKMGEEINSFSLIQFLHTVVISKQWAVSALLSLLLIPQEVREQPIRVIVTSNKIFHQIFKTARQDLGFTQKLLRKKLWIRTVGGDLSTISHAPHEFENRRFPIIGPKSQYKLSSAGATGSLFFVYRETSAQEEPKFQFQFGSSANIHSNKKIIFYNGIGIKSQLMHFPQELKDPNLAYVVCYGMKQPIAQELKVLPLDMRKKIIFNRLEHKHDHKYFVTFTNTTSLVHPHPLNYCTVVDLPSIKQPPLLKSSSKLSSAGSQTSLLGQDQTLPTIKFLVRVDRGIIKLLAEGKEAILGPNQNFYSSQKIISLGKAEVTLLPAVDWFIQNRETEVDNAADEVQNSKVGSIVGNSFLDRLSSKEKKVLNKICKVKTFEVGSRIQEDHQCGFWISKGALKWENRDTVGRQGYFLGDLRGFLKHQNQIRLGDIQVLKDTWSVQVRLQELFESFLIRFPWQLHQLYEKGEIFN